MNRSPPASVAVTVTVEAAGRVVAGQGVPEIDAGRSGRCPGRRGRPLSVQVSGASLASVAGMGQDDGRPLRAGLVAGVRRRVTGSADDQRNDWLALSPVASVYVTVTT